MCTTHGPPPSTAEAPPVPAPLRLRDPHAVAEQQKEVRRSGGRQAATNLTGVEAKRCGIGVSQADLSSSMLPFCFKSTGQVRTGSTGLFESSTFQFDMGAALGQPKTRLFEEYKATLAMRGKTLAITGCTSGTGLVLARTMAELGAEVFMLNRRSKRADEALQEVQALSPLVTMIECDLMSFESVKKAAAELIEKLSSKGLDVLCNNAGISSFPDEPTVDGFDPQMQTNHLSHFLLTQQVWPLLMTAASLRGEARVVNHSSGARLLNKEPFDVKYYGKNSGQLGGDAESFMQMITFHPPGVERYCHSKLANLIFTYALDDRIRQKSLKVKSLCAHPGLCATSLMPNSERLKGASGAMSLFQQSAEDGTLGLLHCCCDPEAESGDFYGPEGSPIFATGPARKLPREEQLASEERREQVWRASEAAVGAFTV